ncbi:MAG: hypothetical protein O2930_14590 [Acidobacteria bacterium]|nr:hypothetical protein [Acidobacteriota bacterium]
MTGVAHINNATPIANIQVVQRVFVDINQHLPRTIRRRQRTAQGWLHLAVERPPQDRVR